MQIINVLPLISFLCLLLGLFVLSKNPQNKQNLFFFLTCLGLTMWIGGLVLMQSLKVFYVPDKITLFGGLFTMVGVYLFSTVFPNDQKLLFKLQNPFKKNCSVRLIPALVILILIPFNIFIKNVIFQGEDFTPVNGTLYPLLALTEAGYGIAAIVNFFRQYKNSIGYKRQQVVYFFSGLALFILFSVFFDLVLPEMGVHGFKFLGQFSTLIFLGFSAAAILSHSLMDVRILFGRFIVWLVSAIILIYIILETRHLFHKLPINRNSVSIALVFYAILLFYIIQKFLIYVAEKIFLKNLYDSVNSFERLNLLLNDQLNLKEVINLSNKHIQLGLGLKWVYFLDQSTGAKISDLTKHKQVPDFLEDRLSVDRVLLDFAQKIKTPKFLSSSEFESFIQPKHRPIAILPLWDENTFCGYFLLGPQLGFNGLSADQIRRLNSAWAHIQTAYARAILYNSLEQKVASQVKEITTTNHLLKEETEKRMDFLRSASHQLRTPITAMSSSLQLLADNLEESESKELAQMAFSKSKNLNTIVQSMLTLAKVEQSAESDFKNIISVNDLIREVISTLNQKAEAKNLQIAFVSAPDTEVVGNKAYLEQAIFNLIDNALEYTDSGEVKVSFIIEPQFVIISIKDSGPGIPDNYKDQIFQKHIRSSSSKGNGLGLYITKAIVAAHPKAHIWFESETGKGTTFYLRLVRKI